jgi:hypothetical protein
MAQFSPGTLGALPMLRGIFAAAFLRSYKFRHNDLFPFSWQ